MGWMRSADKVKHNIPKRHDPRSLHMSKCAIRATRNGGSNWASRKETLTWLTKIIKSDQGDFNDRRQILCLFRGTFRTAHNPRTLLLSVASFTFSLHSQVNPNRRHFQWLVLVRFLCCTAALSLARALASTKSLASITFSAVRFSIQEVVHKSVSCLARGISWEIKALPSGS